MGVPKPVLDAAKKGATRVSLSSVRVPAGSAVGAVRARALADAMATQTVKIPRMSLLARKGSVPRAVAKQSERARVLSATDTMSVPRASVLEGARRAEPPPGLVTDTMRQMQGAVHTMELMSSHSPKNTTALVSAPRGVFAGEPAGRLRLVRHGPPGRPLLPTPPVAVQAGQPLAWDITPGGRVAVQQQRLRDIGQSLGGFGASVKQGAKNAASAVEGSSLLGYAAVQAGRGLRDFVKKHKVWASLAGVAGGVAVGSAIAHHVGTAQREAQEAKAAADALVAATEASGRVDALYRQVQGNPTAVAATPEAYERFYKKAGKAISDAYVYGMAAFGTNAAARAQLRADAVNRYGEFYDAVRAGHPGVVDRWNKVLRVEGKDLTPEAFDALLDQVATPTGAEGGAR